MLQIGDAVQESQQSVVDLFPDASVAQLQLDWKMPNYLTIEGFGTRTAVSDLRSIQKQSANVQSYFQQKDLCYAVF